MKKKWQELAPHCWVSDYRAGGLPCRSTVVQLANGQYLVYSPSPSVESFEQEIGGDVAFILAPSSYHTVGIRPWLERYPQSRLVCADSGRSRLMKKTGVTPIRIDELARNLEGGTTKVIEVPFTKAGEVWLETQIRGETAWFVCDAFFNLGKSKNPLMRTMQWLFKSGPGLRISRIYKYAAVKDRAAMRLWLTERLKLALPTILVPCHGKVIQDRVLPSHLQALVDEMF